MGLAAVNEIHPHQTVFIVASFPISRDPLYVNSLTREWGQIWELIGWNATLKNHWSGELDRLSGSWGSQNSLSKNSGERFGFGVNRRGYRYTPLINVKQVE